METELIRIEDILIGPAEAENFLKSVSKVPLGARSIASYVTLGRIPVLKRGSTTLFSKAALMDWDRQGRPNTGQEIQRVFS
jgi:hypothetical protein